MDPARGLLSPDSLRTAQPTLDMSVLTILAFYSESFYSLPPATPGPALVPPVSKLKVHYTALLF